MRKALITGITGQDGSYLADLLLSKGYEVHGIIRRSSNFNTQKINHIYDHPNLHLHYGDITDMSSLEEALIKSKPDEIYNLAAQSHVKVSFELPIFTANTVATGTLMLLEATKRYNKKTPFYQASSSEMFGQSPPPQNEETPFQPRSPYAVSKVAAYNYCVNYREAHDMHISNGILFNHESERRGETFVTRKITRAIGRIKEGLQDKLYLGNLIAKRDWGHAQDYVEAMWLMLQQKEPDDYVIASGDSHTVKGFLDCAFSYAGLDPDEYVKIDPKYFRPTEVSHLLGNAKKARRKLGWKPKIKFKGLVKKMVDHDMKLALIEKTTKDQS